MNEAACGEQLGWGTLVDYWLAALPPNEEDRVEEHLMGCDSCGARFEEVIGLCDGIRRVARSGVLRVIISESFLERAANAGLQVRQYSVPAGGSVNCTVKAEDDLLVGRLAIDLGSATQVDLSVCDSSGVEQERVREVPVRAGQREIIFSHPIDQARRAPAHMLVIKVLAAKEAGERVLGEYTFNHSPSW